VGKTQQPKAANPRSAPATVPLEELARQQGVTPISDLDELGALWPADDDPDEFAEFIASERSARRRLVDG